MKKNILLVLVLVTFAVIVIKLNKKSVVKLDNLYTNPIEINQEYGDYIYNEYKNYVTIYEYSGHEKNVNIPNYINNKPVLAIDDSAFYGNQYIEEVTIPSNVIRIGHQTFIGCDNLKEVVLPDELRELGYHAFDACPSLEKIYVKYGSLTEKTVNETKFGKYIYYKK